MIAVNSTVNQFRIYDIHPMEMIGYSITFQLYQKSDVTNTLFGFQSYNMTNIFPTYEGPLLYS